MTEATLPSPLGRIRSRRAVVGMVGLGYVGLGEGGFPVIGFDSDPGKAEAPGRGESYIRHLGSDRVACASPEGGARHDRFEALAEYDALLIYIPTPLGLHREPGLSFVRSAAEEIARRLRPGQLVVLESTTYPGTTREEFLPRLTARRFTCGKDSRRSCRGAPTA